MCLIFRVFISMKRLLVRLRQMTRQHGSLGTIIPPRHWNKCPY